METIKFISGPALDFLLRKIYNDEFVVIDGLSQHPNGWSYHFWLLTNDLIDIEEYNRLEVESNLTVQKTGPMEYIFYGSTEFKKEKFQPIKNDGQWIKPGTTGLWASPVSSEYGWKDWCEDEQFRDCEESNSFRFTLSEDARVYEIHDYDDLHHCPHMIDTPHGLSKKAIDFEKMATEYDAIFLSANGQCETRLSRPLTLYGWDCECILILNPDVIRVSQTVS